MRTYRNSLEKHNAPFRGVSSRSDYVNHRMAVTHDLLEIYNLSGGNPEIEGHKQVNENNLNAVVSGDKEITTEGYTAGTIKKVMDEQHELSDLSNWTIPALTQGTINKRTNKGWVLNPPDRSKGFFELEKAIKVSAGEKLLIRFKPKVWDYRTVYSFGALNFDSAGDRYEQLTITPTKNYTQIMNGYFEHILRFNEEREVKLSIKTENSSNGILGTNPLTIEEFGIYHIEETDVYIKGIDTEIKPIVNNSELMLKHLERRRK